MDQCERSKAMTEPDKADAADDDKRDKGDATSAILSISLAATESSDTVEELLNSDKIVAGMSPMQELSEDEYSEGQWIKGVPADGMQHRETAQEPTDEKSPPSYGTSQVWDYLSSTTEDRDTAGGTPSLEASPKQSVDRISPVALRVVPTLPSPIPASYETEADSQSYISATVDSSVPNVGKNDEAEGVALRRTRSLTVYDTETSGSRHAGGTETSIESRGPDQIKDAEVPGALPDRNPPKTASFASRASNETLPRLGEYRPTTEESPSLNPLPSSTSTTRLVHASPDKVGGRPPLRQHDVPDASLKTRIPSCLLLFNLSVALILVLVAHLLTLRDVLNEPPPTAPTASYRPDRPVCRGVHCSGAGTHIFYTLNHSADPCQSAFDLVCRPWVRQTPANYWRVLLGAERVFVYHALLQVDKQLRSNHLTSSGARTSSAKLASLYNRCMDGSLRDSEGLRYFRNVMRRYELHQWPYRDGDIFFGQLRRSLKRFVHDTGSDPYFKVQLRKSSSHTLVLAIDCPSLGLPPMSFVNSTADVGRYIQYAETIIQETSENAANARSVATSIVQFETDVARLHVTYCNAREFSHRAIDELPVNEWKWKEFISFITEGTINQDAVLVRSWDYLNGVIAIIGKNDVTGANYLGWKVASRLLPYATTRTASLTEQFLVSTGLQARAIFRQCLTQVNQVLPFAMGRLYVRATQPTSTSYAAYSVAYHVIRSLDRKVHLKRWFGDRVEESYHRFTAAMGMTLGFPSWVDNDTLLDAHYASVNITNSYLESHMSAATATFQRTFDRATSLRGRETLLFPNDVQWTKDPSTPPMYDLLDNHLYLLPAVLQPPYFVEHTAPALNFGGLGFLLARDLVDEVVSLRKGGWPGLQVTTEMRKPFKCLADRLQDPVATSLLGTKLAYLSYQMNRGFGDDEALRGLETTSPDQLFFIAIGRTLCSVVRDRDYVNVVSRRSPIGAENLVDAVLLNLPEYLDAFNCSRDGQGSHYDMCFRK